MRRSDNCFLGNKQMNDFFMLVISPFGQYCILCHYFKREDLKNESITDLASQSKNIFTLGKYYVTIH